MISGSSSNSVTDTADSAVLVANRIEVVTPLDMPDPSSGLTPDDERCCLGVFTKADAVAEAMIAAKILPATKAIDTIITVKNDIEDTESRILGVDRTNIFWFGNCSFTAILFSFRIQRGLYDNFLFQRSL